MSNPAEVYTNASALAPRSLKISRDILHALGQRRRLI